MFPSGFQRRRTDSSGEPVREIVIAYAVRHPGYANEVVNTLRNVTCFKENSAANSFLKSGDDESKCNLIVFNGQA
jgi:hypothetical protein